MYFVLFETFYQSISLSIKFISHKSNPTLNTSFEFSLGFREESLCVLWIVKLNKLKESEHLEHGGNDQAVAKHGGEAGGVQGRGQDHVGHLGELGLWQWAVGRIWQLIIRSVGVIECWAKWSESVWSFEVFIENIFYRVGYLSRSSQLALLLYLTHWWMSNYLQKTNSDNGHKRGCQC